MSTRVVAWIAVAVAQPAWAAVARLDIPVPALDAAGLALLVVVVGGVASWAARRRK